MMNNNRSKRLNRFAYRFVMLFLTALIVVQPVFACEPSREWDGDNLGLPVILPDDSKIVCEESIIRYSVETYKGEDGHKLNDDYLSYSGTLSERHILVNGGQEIEEIRLVFSEYAGTVKKLKIYNEETGEEKDCITKTAHTFSEKKWLDEYYWYYDNEFDFEKSVKMLEKTADTDSFFEPEMKVTEYRVRFSGIDETAENPFAFFSVPAQEAHDVRRIVIPNKGATLVRSDMLEIGFPADTGSELVFYVIGEKLPDEIEWQIVKYKDYETVYDGSVLLEENGEMTFRDFALKEYEKYRGGLISEKDWYNAVVNYMQLPDFGNNSISLNVDEGALDIIDFLDKWETKSFSLNSGEKVVIEILSNVRPYGHLGYVTPVYEFKYSYPEGLSHSDDAEITVMVSTVYNIVRSNIRGFDTARSEFVLSPEDIPEDGIEFALSKSSEWPEEARGINTDWGMVGFVASIMSGPVLLVAALVALVFVFTSKK